jgi:hypothetical protein
VSGTALTVGFNDFVEATGPTYVTGPEDLVNDAQLRTYSFKYLTYGDTGNKKMIQGGSDIRESVVFQDNGTFRFRLPGEIRDWENPQRLQKVKAFWRFSDVHMAWTRQEILLNDRIKYGTAEAKFHAYVDLRNEKELLMWTAKWNGMEQQLWVQPVVEDQEAEAGREPYSIPAFVNEFTNGLFDPLAAGETVWTTVEGLDPTNTADNIDEFVPQQRTYDAVAANDDGNIISIFDMMWKDVRFEQPPSMQEYFDNPAYNRQCIFTSRVGQSAYQQLLRQSQDAFVVAGRQDPSYADPMYYGIPVKWVEQLDTATLYGNPASNDVVAESAADSIGPRFYWLNTQYLYPVFHDEMYFEKDEVTRHHNDPDTFVCPVATWYQILCTSRRRQGIVSPSADVYASLY